MPALINTPEQVIRQWERWYVIDLMSMRDIAKRIGRSPNFVRDRFLQSGITLNKSQHLSVKSKGRDSPKKRYRFSAEGRQRLSNRMKGNSLCAGRKLSDQSKQRMSDAMKRRQERWVEEGRVDPHSAQRTEHARQRIKRLLRAVLRASGEQKLCRSEIALGFPGQELIDHIEKQFQVGMSWDRRESFSIDHRIPIAAFIRRGITDPRIICSLANLQPLAPRENRLKSDKYEGDFDADLRTITAFNQLSQETAP